MRVLMRVLVHLWAKTVSTTVGRIGLGLGLLTSGCESDLTPASFIKAGDIVGARTEVLGDPTRSQPRPGEQVAYAPFVVLPERDPDLSELSTVAVECTAPGFFLGVPVCQELLEAGADTEIPEDGTAGLLALAGGDAAELRCDSTTSLTLGPLTLHCAVGLPRFTLTAPTATATGTSGAALQDPETPPARLVSGILCNAGTAVVSADPESPFRCEPRDDQGVRDAVPFYGQIPVEPQDATDNRNPEADALRLRLKRAGDDRYQGWPAWTASQPPPPDACEQPEALGLSPVPFGEEVSVEVRYDREAIERGPQERETIEIATYVNAGEVDRLLTVFRPETLPADGESPVGEQTWTAPSQSENDAYARREADDPVRFTTVIRDGRGGQVRVDHYLCLE